MNIGLRSCRAFTCEDEKGRQFTASSVLERISPCRARRASARYNRAATVILRNYPSFHLCGDVRSNFKLWGGLVHKESFRKFNTSSIDESVIKI